jgi:DNA-binding response OmpR family regulator
VCKVLVADDSATVRTRVGRILKDAGYEVMTASNGRDAAQLLAEELPSVAILDVGMPLLDGFGVLHETKQMGPPWDQIPIIFLTMHQSQALEMLGTKFGAYLHKPADETELLEIVNRFCLHPDDEAASPLDRS